MSADPTNDFRSSQFSEVSDSIPAPPPPPPSFGAPPAPPPPSMSGGGAPPPPPVFGGHIPSMRLKSEISDRKEPPAAIQNAMMTKDKKPFTYTPGGIDLSEIRSPRMQKRIVRNQNAPDTHIPQSDASRPKLALTPGAQAAMQSQVAFPVFPAGQVPSLPSQSGSQQNGSSQSPQQKTNQSQQSLPPPPPQRSSQLLNSPLSEGTPKANLPWLQKTPQQKELPPWVHDNSDTQYSPAATQQQTEGRNTPTLQQQHNAPSPQPSDQQYQPQQRQQLRPSPLTQPNSTSQPQPPSRWAHVPSSQMPQQQEQREPQWQQPPQPQNQWQQPSQPQTQWQPVTTQRTESPVQKRWPQQPETPVQKQWPSQQQTEVPVQRQWQAPHTVEIPVQRETPSTWQPTSPQASGPPQWQSPPPPPQRAHTPQPHKDANPSQAGHNVRLIPIQIENGNNSRRSQPSSPQINGNGTPIQSKSFKVLQKVTNSDSSEFLESDAFSIDGVPFSQFSNVHISDQGNFKTNVPQVQVRIMTNVPRSGPSTPQPSDNGPPQYMQQAHHQGNTSSHSYQVRQAMTTSQFSDCTEREVNGYYSYPPLPPPPPHYHPTYRPSSTPPYPSPLFSPPTPPPVTPPPTPEQYQQMWQHFNNFYAYYYQQPPTQLYYPPPPPYPGSTYSFTYPSDTEDGYSGYSSTEEMNGYFNKQRQYQQRMRGAQIESVENSETEYETSDTEKPNEYQVKLYESEEDTDYPMTTSIESADSVVGDYLSTIVEESEISDRKSQCSDCTLEKLSEDENEEEINTDEEVVFVKLPLSVNRKDEVTTIIVGNSSKMPETNTDEESKESGSKGVTKNLISPSKSIGAENYYDSERYSSSTTSKNQNNYLGNKIDDFMDYADDSNNTFLNKYIVDKNEDHERKSFKKSKTDNEKDVNIVETYEEKKVKEKSVKNTETKISICYNGLKDEKVLNAVKKRTNKSTKSVFTSRLSGENFDFDCWNESDVSQQEEVLDDTISSNRDSNRDKFDDLHGKRSMNTDKQNLLLKQSIVRHVWSDENEPNISVTLKFPLKRNLPKHKNGVISIIQPEEVYDPEQKHTRHLDENSNMSTPKQKQREHKTCSISSSRCESPYEENSQSSVKSEGNSQKSSKSSESEENVTPCSFLQNLSSILQNIKMSKSMEKEELGQTCEKQELFNTFVRENYQNTAIVNSIQYETNVDTLQDKTANYTSMNEVDVNIENDVLKSFTVGTKSNTVVDADGNESDEVDFWAEIGQSEDHMHLSMTKSQIEEFEAASESDVRGTQHTLQMDDQDLSDVLSNNKLDNQYGRGENRPDSSNSDSDESCESESESKSDSSEDSTTSEDSTPSSSSCEEDEEEGRTFVFYHEIEDKSDTHCNDLSISNPPEIRIQSNDEQQDLYSDSSKILNYAPTIEEELEINSEAFKSERSSISSEQCNSYEIQETHTNTETTNNTLHVHERRRSSQYLDESEEDDSGVTSDISRQISETDTDHDQEFTELKKMSAYKRANTHSRLYQLLQDECDFEKPDTTSDTAVLSKEKLSLPLGCNSIDNSNVSTPTSPVVSEKLVKELVQSLLNKKKGRIFRNLPVEKLHAAAIRILQEDVDYDTFSSTSGESSLLESPADHSPIATPLQRAAHRGSGAYTNYSEYYETWASASVRESLGSDIIPSRAFKILQEHVKPGIGPGFIEGLQAKCPKVSSATNLPSVLEVRDSLTPVPENYP